MSSGSPDHPIGEDIRSRGHIANVVACAEFLTSRFSMGCGGTGHLGHVPAQLDFGRTLDRAHWTSDQLIGAAFGYAVGRQVALRSKRRRADHRSAQTSNHSGLFISPQRGALKLGWNHPL